MFNPELYFKNNQNQRRGAVEIMDIFQEKFQEHFGTKQVKLIDIGTGCGTTLQAILEKSEINFSKVVGVDKSSEMIKFATENYGSEIVSFQVMDMQGKVSENLQKEFDICTSFFTLHFCNNLEQTFRNFSKVLNANGFLVCNAVLMDDIVPIYGKLAKKYPEYLENWKSVMTPLWHAENPIKELKGHLEKAGFKTLIIPTQYEFEMKSMEDMAGKCKFVETDYSFVFPQVPNMTFNLVFFRIFQIS